MRISIIIPVYNVEFFLEDCIKSVLKQLFSDYEIILINDSSTDNSWKIAEKYASLYTHIRLFQNKTNRGPGYTRNVGISNARGKYCLFLDADDMLADGCLNKLWEITESASQDVVVFEWEMIYESTWRSGIVGNTNKSVVCLEMTSGRDLFFRLLETGAYKSTASTLFVLTAFLRENRIFFREDIYHEDVLFSFLCLQKAKCASYTNERFYIYRRRESSISSKIELKNIESEFLVFFEILLFWKRVGFNKNEEQLIRDYMADMVSFIMAYKDLWKNKEISLGDTADRFLWDVLSFRQEVVFPHVCLTDSDIHRLGKEGKIWIYGAGLRGLETLRFLKSRGIQVQGIVVTKNAPGSSRLETTRIYEVDEADISNVDTVLICVRKEHQKDVLEKVTKYSCQTVIACK